MKKSSGMTLIEMIIAIVLMGIAMVAFTSFLVPQIRDSAIPHYQTRASALAQSFMSQILARGFDENSDLAGGETRCGEGLVGSEQETCTVSGSLGAEEGAIASFDDVDDYIGCWYTQSTHTSCNSTPQYELSNVLGTSIESDYTNFRVEVDVVYVNESGSVSNDIEDYKRVTLTIHAGRTQSLKLTAIKGNY
ncbi:type IV pilus modification PilV family protein [Vibrio alginolyticus]|uniref:type II secretion system protein n=1 Tax=Vibrio TaxID=662 RepID=UPI0005ABB64A|nr:MULTISPECIES: type II secretion system protein [Vibrio]EGR0169201.1 type II secretion system protein [Vibrio alginolyticus]EIE5867518.1 type II secretion system protein [Vibrio alginolyticus]EKA5862305.1 type II secretion system protein [Vibrio alginolyticus]ELA6649314.1 type II secretion system protein [Vibrio alginolyticus]ELA9084588.1 type II secretion system protein [Vibrio alginolyticus]